MIRVCLLLDERQGKFHTEYDRHGGKCDFQGIISHDSARHIDREWDGYDWLC